MNKVDNTIKLRKKISNLKIARNMFLAVNQMGGAVKKLAEIETEILGKLTIITNNQERIKTKFGEMTQNHIVQIRSMTEAIEKSSNSEHQNVILEYEKYIIELENSISSISDVYETAYNGLIAVIEEAKSTFDSYRTSNVEEKKKASIKSDEELDKYFLSLIDSHTEFMKQLEDVKRNTTQLGEKTTLLVKERSDVIDKAVSLQTNLNRALDDLQTQQKEIFSGGSSSTPVSNPGPSSTSIDENSEEDSPLPNAESANSPFTVPKDERVKNYCAARAKEFLKTKPNEDQISAFINQSRRDNLSKEDIQKCVEEQKEVFKLKEYCAAKAKEFLKTKPNEDEISTFINQSRNDNLSKDDITKCIQDHQYCANEAKEFLKKYNQKPTVEQLDKFIYELMQARDGLSKDDIRECLKEQEDTHTTVSEKIIGSKPGPVPPSDIIADLKLENDHTQIIKQIDEKLAEYMEKHTKSLEKFTQEQKEILENRSRYFEELDKKADSNLAKFEDVVTKATSIKQETEAKKTEIKITKQANRSKFQQWQDQQKKSIDKP